MLDHIQVPPPFEEEKVAWLGRKLLPALLIRTGKCSRFEYPPKPSNVEAEPSGKNRRGYSKPSPKLQQETIIDNSQKSTYEVNNGKNQRKVFVPNTSWKFFFMPKI